MQKGDNKEVNRGKERQSSEDNKYRYTRQPKCARCRNHDVIVNVKGHKRYCPYKKCICANCILVADRRRIMALQTGLRRTQTEENIAGRLASTSEQTISRSSAFRSVIRSTKYVTKQQLQESLHYILSKLEILHTVPSVSIYTILKEYGFDQYTAYNKILQGYEDMKIIFESPSTSVSFDSSFSPLPQRDVEYGNYPPLTILAPQYTIHEGWSTVPL